jgi:hypothetical protein
MCRHSGLAPQGEPINRKTRRAATPVMCLAELLDYAPAQRWSDWSTASEFGVELKQKIVIQVGLV